MSDAVTQYQLALGMLRNQGPSGGPFPAFRDFVLGAPSSEDKVMAIETRFGVSLPFEYRDFIVHYSGSGGGPGCGLLPLNRDDAEDFCGIDDLEFARFPFDQKYSDSRPLSPDGASDMSDEDFETLWYLSHHPKWSQGAIYIADYGCAIRAMLIVTGKDRGRINLDDPNDNTNVPFTAVEAAKFHGKLKHRSRNSHLTFNEWYEDWLNVYLEAYDLRLIGIPA